MTAGHVRTLDDYWNWLDQLIAQSGGWLDEAVLFVYPIESDDPFAEEGDYVGLFIPAQRIAFGDGSHLQIRMVVDEDLVLTEYSFHYQQKDGRLIWRKCNHAGHPDVGLVHIHRHPDNEHRAEQFKDVNLEEVITEVWDYMQHGTRP